MFKGDTSYIKLGFATPANIERNHLKAMYEFQQNNYLVNNETKSINDATELINISEEMAQDIDNNNVIIKT